MDKNAIKKYAVWARNELIMRITQRASKYGIYEKNSLSAEVDSINGRLLTDVEKKQRIDVLNIIKDKGFNQTIEEVAYTWFNRFVAIRFMEVNGYLPSHIKVFTDENNFFRPQILSEAINVDINGLDKEIVYKFKEKNQDEELFKYLLIVQCNALNDILPQMFEKLEDYTELLLPDNLLKEGSVIEQLIRLIPEDNFNVQSTNGQVEIIGWMYQYYISEKHDKVVNLKSMVKKEDIPAATQLFTTDWIVRYVVDNSLGRYWIERNPQSLLINKLPYLSFPQNKKIDYINDKVEPKCLKVIDPCMGSGHFLLYAFDVLMEIYKESGYSDRDAVKFILENNIYGLDIDDRSYQLAYFSILMKARQYDRRIFNKNLEPQVLAIQESNDIVGIYREEIENVFSDKEIKEIIYYLLDIFKDGKEFGSVLRLEKRNYDLLLKQLEKLNKEDGEINLSLWQRALIEKLMPLAKQAFILNQKYIACVTNPPYLNKMENHLKEYLKNEFNGYYTDLFSVFMYRNFEFCTKDGYSGLMVPNVWMFLKSYETLRMYIINNKSIVTLIQLAKGAFYKEATVDVCAFVLKNGKSLKDGVFFRQEDYKGDMDVQKAVYLYLLNNREKDVYEVSSEVFKQVPECGLAYWLNKTMLDTFKEKSLSRIAKPRQGLATSDNNRFLRLWFEVSRKKIGMGIDNILSPDIFNYKWFPCTKGGPFRRWYGNNEYVINWENDGKEIKEYASLLYKNYTRTIKNIDFYFKEGLSWSTISSGLFSLRYIPNGFIFETKGAMCFVPSKLKYYLLALYNTKVIQSYLAVVSPTLDYHEGSLGKTPVKVDNSVDVDNLSKECIELSKYDWDSYETSWDFKRHMLVQIKPVGVGVTNVSDTMNGAYEFRKENINTKFEQLKANEKELNSIFINIYGLQAELSPEVAEKDVSIHKIFDSKEDVPESMKNSNYVLTKQDVVKSFISYAVGCMFGRYSLDVEGLVYAGGDWNEVVGTTPDGKKVGAHDNQQGGKYQSYPVDSDNIIPICDDEYFDDDMVGRFIDFVKVVYGEETLEENLKFIADALGGKGSPRTVIRNYFLNEFYADHCKTYQKRPIYWLFDSGKKNGFKCLIYMHRYAPDTIARIRTDYVHEQQARYRTSIEDLQKRIDSASTSERVKLSKQLALFQAKDVELRDYEEKIHYFADKMIGIDLDDGVKNNYAIFQDVLAKIK